MMQLSAEKKKEERKQAGICCIIPFKNSMLGDNSPAIFQGDVR